MKEQLRAPKNKATTPARAFAQTNLLRYKCAPSPGRQLVLQPPLVQTKLTIGQSNDRYEQEADRVADQRRGFIHPQVVTDARVSPGVRWKREGDKQP